jgi:glycosyltransferase involved in cell wall biosynthesis
MMPNSLNRVKNQPTICLLTESYYPIVGGGETQGRIMAEDCIEKGFQVIVITRRSNDDLNEFEKIGEISIYRVPPVGSSHLNRWIMLVTSLPSLIRLVSQYDIIFVSGFRSLGIIGVLISKLFHKVCILKADNNGEMSGDYFKSGLAKWNLTLSSRPVRAFLWLRNLLLKQADAFISLSKEMTQEFVNYGIDQKKINLIPNSVDTTVFYAVPASKKNELRKKLGIKPDDKVVIYTGRLLETKGLPLLIKVWHKIRTEHDKCQLVIVGGGSKDIHDCEEEIKQYVELNRLEDSVKFTGNVTNVDEYLQASDIFVFPTENEAFGISLIEAMACGLPVIATPVGGIKDIVNNGKNGLIVEVGSFAELHNALAYLISNEDLSKTLGEGALMTVQNYYSRKTAAQQYTKLFERFISV